MWAFVGTRALRCATGLAIAAAIAVAAAGPAGARPKGPARPTPDAPRVAADTAPAARFFTINSVLAKIDGRPVAGPLQVASAPAHDALSDARAPLFAPASDEPFGLFTFRAPEGPLWVKQRKLSTDIAQEQTEMAACRGDAANCYATAALRYIALIEAARRLEGRARLAEVNRTVNAAMVYTSDLVQHGVPDLWSAPLASFASGRGDCEDYAVAKYVALRQAGTSEDDLRILLVRDRAVGQYHAVLAARQDGRWLVLDNRWPDLREDSDMASFTPLFVLDHRGVSLFAAPYAGAAADGLDVTPAGWGEATAGGASTLPLLM